jgi:hypothetical protein
VLTLNGKLWTKKDGSNSLFDVTMGSSDGAEICELVGLFILNHLGKRFGKENICLYRDDGLAIIKSKSARLLDKTRKELHKIFEQFDLKINAEVNLNVVNFSPSRRRKAPCEGTNSPRLFTPGETKALAKSKVHQ